MARTHRTRHFVSRLIHLVLCYINLDIVLLVWCSSVCDPFVFQITPEDGALTPKHVAVFKIYVQFVTLLYALVGIYD
jgi:hypothetical protein